MTSKEAFFLMSKPNPLKKIGSRYAVILGTTLFLFTNFIACGAQMYQVSVEGDMEPAPGNAALPQAATDPSSDAYGIHSIEGWPELPIRFRIGERLDKDQLKGLTCAMKTWEGVVGKKMFDFTGTHEGVHGDTFKDLYSSLRDGVNGNYLDQDWNKTGKPSEVLATTI